jgi:hypothetical protein
MQSKFSRKISANKIFPAQKKLCGLGAIYVTLPAGLVFKTFWQMDGKKLFSRSSKANLSLRTMQPRVA